MSPEEFIKSVVSGFLAEHNIAWQDPRCGHLRSPDDEIFSECPQCEHG